MTKMTINEPNTNMCVYSTSTWCEKAAAAHTACDLLRAHGMSFCAKFWQSTHTFLCLAHLLLFLLSF